MPAKILTVDFSKGDEFLQHASGNRQDSLPRRQPPRTAEGKLLTPKQIRARARRKADRSTLMSDQELEYLYKKPMEEWDLEELSQGRPKNAKGHFRGPKPKWITAAVHEEAMNKYTAAVKSNMRATTVDALGVLNEILKNEDVDDKGKPIVNASTKLDAAKFLIEHVVGKPTQRIENDVSVKLQAILGTVMVNPADLQAGPEGMRYNTGHFPGVTMALAEAREENNDDLTPEGTY